MTARARRQYGQALWPRYAAADRRGRERILDESTGFGSREPRCVDPTAQAPARRRARSSMASSAGKKHSTRSSCSVMSCGVPRVVIEVKNRAVTSPLRRSRPRRRCPSRRTPLRLGPRRSRRCHRGGRHRCRRAGCQWPAAAYHRLLRRDSPGGRVSDAGVLTEPRERRGRESLRVSEQESYRRAVAARRRALGGPGHAPPDPGLGQALPLDVVPGLRGRAISLGAAAFATGILSAQTGFLVLGAVFLAEELYETGILAVIIRLGERCPSEERPDGFGAAAARHLGGPRSPSAWVCGGPARACASEPGAEKSPIGLQRGEPVGSSGHAR